MVKEGSDFVVHDAKSGDNITRQVLTQIIFEEEAKGENLLPIDFLRQLIRFYGDSMQSFVPSYLQFSMDHLTREHERLREEMVGSAGTETDKVNGRSGAHQHGDVPGCNAIVQPVCHHAECGG